MSNINFDGYINNNIILINFINIASRIAVPCFIMLSGAFLLDNEKNKNVKYFYQKFIKKIGTYILLFIAFYFFYNLLKNILLMPNFFSAIKSSLYKLYIGQHAGHLWYVYVLFATYMVTPFLIRLKEDIGESNFCKLSLLLLILSIFAFNTSTHLLNWDIGYLLYFISYFMIGYAIRKKLKVKSKNFLFLLFYLVISFVDSLIMYNFCKKKLSIDNYENLLTSNFSPFIVSASCCIFIFFSKININIKKFNKVLCMILQNSLLIYLIHGFVWEILLKLVNKLIPYYYVNKYDILLIIILTIIVLVISLLLSIIFEKIWKKFDNKFEISNKLCKLFNLC